MRKTESGVHGVVELGELSNPGAQQTPDIQHHPHGLAALRLVDFGYQLAATGRCGPTDVPKFVAGMVLPQSLEFPAPSSLPRAAFFHLNLPAAHQVDDLPLGFLNS